MPSSVSSSGTQPQHRSHVSKLSQSHHPDMSRSATPLPNGTGKPNGHRDASTPSSMPRKPSDQLQQLANRLSLLNDILQPLPPTLPPSPPLSPKRLKRKSLEDDDVPPTSLGAAAAESGVKRARLSAEASPPTHSRHPSSTQTSDPRAASPNSGSASSSSRSTSAVKREEGELEESPSVSRVASFSSRANGITRQPRPRKTFDASTFSKMSEHYQNTAKLFKRSATKRRSPNGNASHAMEFIACLEDTDSVLHFAYSFWAMGQQRGSTSQLAKTWESIQDYIIFVHRGWEKLLSVTQDSERKARIRMITGLLALIRYSAYFQVHKLHFYRLKASNENVTASSPSHRNSASPPGFQPTPPYTSTPMPPPAQNAAPSPASSSPPGGQPNNHRGQPMVGQSPQHLGHSGPTVSVPVDMLTMQSKLLHAQTEMTSAQGRYSAELTLFNISRLFPKAYEVCIGNAPNSWTPLVPGRKEDWPLVDVEACGRGEGDWAWPPVSGDDVPHAVGFGRSILREFGDCYGGGYKGLEGTLK